MRELSEEVAELKLQLRDERQLRKAIEEIAETIVNVWRRGREGDFDTDTALLAALETPIEVMERNIFTQ